MGRSRAWGWVRARCVMTSAGVSVNLTPSITKVGTFPFGLIARYSTLSRQP